MYGLARHRLRPSRSFSPARTILIYTNGTTLVTSGAGGRNVNIGVVNSGNTSASTRILTQTAPFPGILRNFYVTTNAGPTGTITAKMRKNGVDGVISLTVSGTNVTGSDLVNEVRVARGDLLVPHLTLTSGLSFNCLIQVELQETPG